MVEAIVTDLRNGRESLSSVKWDTQVAWNNTKAIDDTHDYSNATFWDVIGWVNEILDERVNNCSGASDDAKFLAGYYEAVYRLNTLPGELDAVLTDDVTEITDDNWGTFEGLYEDVIEYESYIDNTTHPDSVIREFKSDVRRLKSLVSNYSNDYLDDRVEQFVTGINAEEVIEGTTVKELLDGAKFERDNLDTLTSFIEDIKAGDYTYGLATYDLVKDENDVVEIIEGLEAIAETIEEVNTLMDSDEREALEDVERKVNDLAKASNDEDETYVDDAIAEFSKEEIEIVQTYVEDFFNEFYTVNVRRLSNGKYSARLEATDYVTYLNSDDEDLENSAIADVLTKLVDEDERVGDTYYDALLAAEPSTKEDLMEIVEAAEDIELKFSYTSTEVEAVYDAFDAVDELLGTVYGEIDTVTFKSPYDLTVRETRSLKTLRNQLIRIINRIEQSDVTITEVKDWWVFENGQWVFYQDGHTVSNRWVASNATDWYYAGANGVMLTNSWIARDSSLQVWYYVGADGKMVTNTVVDGCTIDANGEWHA